MKNENLLKICNERFYYESGKLFIKTRYSNAVKVNTEAGTFQGGRRQIAIAGAKYATHRLIYLMHHYSLPKYVGHLNQDSTDNRIENLYAMTNNSFTKNNIEHAPIFCEKLTDLTQPQIRKLLADCATLRSKKKYIKGLEYTKYLVGDIQVFVNYDANELRLVRGYHDVAKFSIKNGGRNKNTYTLMPYELFFFDRGPLMITTRARTRLKVSSEI
jgi:hypothetical protein